MFEDPVRVVAITSPLLLAATVMACTSDATSGAVAARPAQIRVESVSVDDMTPKPPFDETPITPVETAGASRAE